MITEQVLYTNTIALFVETGSNPRRTKDTVIFVQSMIFRFMLVFNLYFSLDATFGDLYALASYGLTAFTACVPILTNDGTFYSAFCKNVLPSLLNQN